MKIVIPVITSETMVTLDAEDNWWGTIDGVAIAAGSHVIRMNQPYASFANTMLEVQHYPDLREYPGGPPQRPYDVTAHTLGYLLDFDAIPVLEGARAIPAQPFAGEK